MEKTNVCKLSFFKKHALLRQLKKNPASVPQQYQAALLDAVSAKTFQNYYSDFSKFAPDAFDVLLELRNKEKFKYCKFCGFTPDQLANEFVQKGTDEQVLDVLETHCCTLGNVLLERPSELFERYVRRMETIPLNLWKEIIKQKREDLILMFLKFRNQDNVLSEQYVNALFDSALEKSIQAYLEQNSVFGLSRVSLYILKSGDFALCKKLLENNPLTTAAEYEQLFKLNQPELILILVKKMLQDDEDSAYEIPDDFEVVLINSGAIEAIKLYIQNNELDYGATFHLFKSGNEELIRFYLESDYFKDCKKFPFDAAAMSLFAGNNTSLQYCYESKFGLPYQLERELVISEQDRLFSSSKDKKHTAYTQSKFASYICAHELYPLNAALLMEKGSIEDALNYFQKYPLPDIAVVALFKNGKDKLRQAYLDFLLERQLTVCACAQKYFVKFAPKQKLMTYLQNISKEALCDDGQMALLKREDMELCQVYTKRFGFSSKALIVLIQSGSVDFIKAIFQKYRLPNDVIKAMIESGRNSVMIEFFKESDLEEEFEKELILSNFSKNEKAVCFYLDKYDLFTDNEVELLKLNNKKMIEVYLAKHYLSEEAIQLYASMY